MVAPLIAGAIALLPIIEKVAPWLARKLGGEDAGDLAKEAVGTIGAMFGTTDKDVIEAAIAADPNLALKFKTTMLELQDRELQRAHDRAIAELDDVKNARGSYASVGGATVPGLAWITVVLFFVSNGMVLFGAYKLLTVGVKVSNTDLAIAVAGLIGNIQGYVNAKTDLVYGFFFGSSTSARANAVNMASTLGDIAKKAFSK